MKKSSRYIVICITALFLSFCIPVVSIAMETTTTYLEPTVPTISNGTFYLVSDSSSSFPPTFTNYYENLGDYNYGYVMTNSLSSYSSFQLDYTFNVSGNYNTIEIPVILGSSLSFVSFNLFFRENEGSSEKNISVPKNWINNALNSGEPYYNSNYDMYVGVTSLSIPGPTGNNSAYLLSFYTENHSYSIYRVQQYWSFGNRSGHFLLPIYKMGLKVTTYTEWEQEQKQMHEQTLNEISQIGDDVSRVGVEVSRVGSEVSKVGDEISQFYNDLTSLPSDFDESSYQGVVDSVSSSVSDITSYEGIINDAIESNASDVANFDVSGLESYVDEGLSPLTNDTEDIAFESFLKNMYDSLGMATYFIVFAPFAIIFVLFKFVIGGIT